MPDFPRILIIAGSDSGGGAGIQADIKTVSMLGGYAMTAVTAITAQNTQGVEAIHPIPAEIITKQCQVVIDDIGVDAIKIGMLHDVSTIEAVSSVIEPLDVPIVLDPVMVATSGDRLLDGDAVEALVELMNCATLVTPNLPEAAILSRWPLPDEGADDRTWNKFIDEATHEIELAGAKGVLIKGGHRVGDELTDYLSAGEIDCCFTSMRIDSTNTHGTGCTLSSAIATELGKGTELMDAVSTARAYVYKAIQTAPGYGHGHGPLNHLHPLVGSE